MEAESRLSHPSPGAQDCTVAWLCSHEIGYIAAKSLLDEVYEIALPLDFTDHGNYCFGRAGQNVVVVAFRVPLLQIRRQFDAVRLVLLVGVGSGVPDLENDIDIRLGDVVVSTFFVHSSLDKDFLHFRYIKQGSRWDDSPIIEELSTFQLELKHMVDNMRKEHSPVRNLKKMGYSRRTHVEQHIKRLNDGEQEGFTWETAHIRNSLVKYEGTSIEVMEFEVIFARKEPEVPDDELSDYIVHCHSGGKHVGIREDAAQCLPPKPNVLMAAVPNQQAWQNAQDFTVWSSIDTLYQRSPDLRSTFVYPGQTKDILYCAACDQPSSLPSESCESHILREFRMGRTCATHYGVTTVGNQVVVDVGTRNMLSSHYGALCIEASTTSMATEVPHIVIRGVCDYADSHQYVEWQPFAAVAAAAYAKKLSSDISLDEDQIEALGKNLTRFPTPPEDVVDPDYLEKEEWQRELGRLSSTDENLLDKVDSKTLTESLTPAETPPTVVGLEDFDKEEWQREVGRMLSTDDDEMRDIVNVRNPSRHEEATKERVYGTQIHKYSDVPNKDKVQQVQRMALNDVEKSSLKRVFSTRSGTAHAIRRRNRKLLPKSLDMNADDDKGFVDWKTSFGLLRRLTR